MRRVSDAIAASGGVVDYVEVRLRLGEGKGGFGLLLLWNFIGCDFLSLSDTLNHRASILFHVVSFVSSSSLFVVRRYVLVVDQLTMRPVTEVGPGRQVVMPVAAKYGDVRLLDNVEIGGEAP